MNKSDKFNIALILQDIESLYTGNVQNNITSTAGSLAAGIKKDGFDQKDLAKLMLDQSFDQDPQGIMQKIQNNVSLHYDEIEKLFSKNKDWKGLVALETILTESPDFETFGNSLMNYINSVEKKQPGGIIHKDGEHCDTKHCAEFSNGYLRDLGYGTWGNAWDLNDVELLYSGYDISKRPKMYDENLVSQYNIDASNRFFKEFDSKSLDKNQVYVVNMFYKGSSKQKDAFRDGRDGIAGTHTGYLQYDTATNNWVVVHNIGSTVHVDNFIRLQSGDGKYGITAIFKPVKSKPTAGAKIKKAIRDTGKRANEAFVFLSEHPSPAFFATGGQFETNDNWIDVSVGGKQYKVVLASSEEEKEQGLQNAESLESNEGMLFDYLDQPQRKISFWMKDTTIEIDIVFINDKFKVESVQTGTPLSEELITCKPKNGTIVYVLEVPANSGIEIGDDILIDSNEQDNSENNEKNDPDLVGASLEILGSDGSVQAVLQGGERIFSIKNTKTLVSMAKRAYESQSDSDYKALGRKIFEYMKIQDERDPEYVDN